MDFPGSDQSYLTKLTAVDAIYLDFSKASNSVSCKILGTQLSHYTVDGWADSWLKSSWMVGLKGQRVIKGLCLPGGWWQWKATSGSDLGPVLFDITGAPLSDLSTEPSVARLQQGSPKHFYHIAVVQLSVSAFCKGYV